MTIRDKQANIYEEQLELEMRILYRFLPSNFDDLENFLASDIYLPVIEDQTLIQFKNKRLNIIKETKRQYLKILFHALEIGIQEFDQQYQYELEQLKINLLNQINENNSMMYYHIEEYLNSQTENLKKDISKKILSYRKIFLRNRQRSSKSKNTISVSPEPYLDLITNPFNKNEWNYLSLGKFDNFYFLSYFIFSFKVHLVYD